ncbi:hypothetical protein V8E51_012138 [Hyaloscypha variabilis]
MSTLNEFRLFSSLPSELRVKIWGIALPQSVNIICQDSVRFAKSFKSNDRPPALLHACHESRVEALKTYKPLSQGELSLKYVALPLDMIIVSNDFLKYMGKVELQGIQRMRINIKESYLFVHFGTMHLRKMQSSLRELELIFEAGEMYNRGDRHLLSVVDNIRREIKIDPRWNCPNIKIIDGKTGEIVERFPGRNIEHEEYWQRSIIFTVGPGVGP